MTSPVECLRYDALDSKRMFAERSRTWVSDPAIVYEQKEFLKIIKHALSELPDRLAQVFILREVIELNSQEICEFMSISIGNLYVMMHPARKRLRQNRQLKWYCEPEKSNDLKAEKWVLEQL